MTLMQMKYAIAVADTKSMNEAARSLFITQPSLSASIKELENEIGVELFKRTNRGITVTPEGEEFLGYARQVVEQAELRQQQAAEETMVICLSGRGDKDVNTIADYLAGKGYLN